RWRKPVVLATCPLKRENPKQASGRSDVPDIRPLKRATAKPLPPGAAVQSSIFANVSPWLIRDRVSSRVKEVRTPAPACRLTKNDIPRLGPPPSAVCDGPPPVKLPVSQLRLDRPAAESSAMSRDSQSVSARAAENGTTSAKASTAVVIRSKKKDRI